MWNILRRNCLLQRVTEGKIQGGIEVTGRQGRRRRKLLDDLRDRRGYSHLKQEALDRTMWRARFGRGFGPVVRQTTEWMNIHTYISVVNLNVNLRQVTFLYQINIGWAVWNKCGQLQCVYETFLVPQFRSIRERPLLGWAVCNAQEMLWRRWWSYNWRSTLTIHPVPHKLNKHSNWCQITQLKKSCHTEYCGRKTLQTDTEDRGT